VVCYNWCVHPACSCCCSAWHLIAAHMGNDIWRINTSENAFSCAVLACCVNVGAGWLWVVRHRQCLNALEVSVTQTEVRTAVRRNISIILNDS
jgi:hypothetical protein